MKSETQQRFLKCIAASILLLVSMPGLSQQIEYPLRLEGSDTGVGSIKLIGGNPEFIVKCMESDFGKGVTSSAQKMEGSDEEQVIDITKVIWSGIQKSEWSKFRVTITLTYQNAHPWQQEYMMFNCPYTIIEFKDANGKILTNDKRVRKAIVQYVTEKFFEGFAFVNSPNGINVRKEPSLTSPVIHKIQDQSKIVVQQETDEWIEIQRSDSTTARTRWIKIALGEGRSGYVVQAFLLPWYSLHPKEIYGVFDFSVNDSGTNEKYYSVRSSIERAGEQQDNPDYLAAWYDTLKQYVDIRLINCDGHTPIKAAKKYQLDTTKIGTPANPTLGGESRNSIKLPIDGGRDSIHIQDEPEEYYTSNYYVGRIPAIDQYVIHSSGFGDGYRFYDIKTGEQVDMFRDIPVFSPDGKYAVDISQEPDPELGDELQTCNFAISTLDLDTSAKINKRISIQFYTWLVNGASWISNTELIISIIPSASRFSPGKREKQCLHMTIKMK